MWPMDDPAWDDYPKLKIVAEGFLTQQEQWNLLTVIKDPNVPVNKNTWQLHSAFVWHDTLMGAKYWEDIWDGIKSMVPLGGPVLAELISADDIPELTGWQPDVVDGANVMEITRNML